MQTNDSSVHEQAPPAPPATPTPGRMAGWMRDILETVLPAFLIVLVVNVFLAQATRVEGQSMEPNLHNDQRLVIEKVSYHFHPPRRGDIIVIKLPSRHSDPPLIKRVVGLPGETIEVRDGHVYVDGHVLEESYLNQLTFGDQPPHTISAGHVFVLGDNRGASNDSRAFGEVALSDIVGRAWLRYWPPDQAGLVR